MGYVSQPLSLLMYRLSSVNVSVHCLGWEDSRCSLQWRWQSFVVDCRSLKVGDFGVDCPLVGRIAGVDFKGGGRILLRTVDY